MRWCCQLLVLISLIAACTPVDTPLPTFAGPTRIPGWEGVQPPVPASSPIVWRVDPDCVARVERGAVLPVGTEWGEARRLIRQGCPQNGHDFVAIAISGGGTKAAIFGAESMFYLDAIGALRRTAMISSVSGGSFAASYYALSCDEMDTVCREQIHNGLKRPIWMYEHAMSVMARGFKPMLWRAGKNFLIPLVSTPVRVASFAEFIDRTYMEGEGSGKAQFLFSDLNPRRPALALNSTLLSGTRPLAESTRALGYLRRRNADEMLHFAFTDYYFNHIGSDLSLFPLSYGVASSAAFPALIGYGELRNFRYCIASRDASTYQECLDRDDTKLTLTDGGANDNQGLIELAAELGELVLQEKRSDISIRKCDNPGDLTCNQYFGKGDRALLFVLNSSITESTGANPQHEIGFRPLGFILGTVGRVSAAVDAYSAAGYNLRRRLYTSNRDEVEQLLKKKQIRITPVEIGLTTLDRYAGQGADVSRRREAGTLVPRDCAAGRRGDPEYVGHELACETQVQVDAWAYLSRREVREDLALGSVHPQCLFEQSKPMESGLASLAKIDDVHVPCLREAARWATALRAEELCQQQARARSPEDQPMSSAQTITCEGPHVKALEDHWKKSFAHAPQCDMAAQIHHNSKSENATLALSLAEADSFAKERREFSIDLYQRRRLAQSGTLDLVRLCDMDDRDSLAPR